MHGSRDRAVRIGESVIHFDALRFRCPDCRATATALPEDVLPGLPQGLDTVAGIVESYLDGDASYRNLTPGVTGAEARPAIGPSDYAEPPYPSPTPSTCFRWLQRFVSGARAWWRLAAAMLLGRDDYQPPSAPGHLNASGRSEAKRAALRDAWHALDAWRRLAVQPGKLRTRWAHLMRRCPRLPTGLDRTGWFIRTAAPP